MDIRINTSIGLAWKSERNLTSFHSLTDCTSATGEEKLLIEDGKPVLVPLSKEEQKLRDELMQE